MWKSKQCGDGGNSLFDSRNSRCKGPEAEGGLGSSVLPLFLHPYCSSCLEHHSHVLTACPSKPAPLLQRFYHLFPLLLAHFAKSSYSKCASLIFPINSYIVLCFQAVSCVCFFCQTRGFLENWVHASVFHKAQLTQAFRTTLGYGLVGWPSNPFPSIYLYSESRLLESGFRRRNVMGEPGGMSGGRASPFRFSGHQCSLPQVLNGVLAEPTHAFLAVPPNQTAVDLCVSSATITLICVLPPCLFFTLHFCL